MPRMKVTEAVISILENEGVEVIFGIPGAGILPFYSALRQSTKIKDYLARSSLVLPVSSYYGEAIPIYSQLQAAIT